MSTLNYFRHLFFFVFKCITQEDCVISILQSKSMLQFSKYVEVMKEGYSSSL